MLTKNLTSQLRASRAGSAGAGISTRLARGRSTMEWFDVVGNAATVTLSLRLTKLISGRNERMAICPFSTSEYPKAGVCDWPDLKS